MVNHILELLLTWPFICHVAAVLAAVWVAVAFGASLSFMLLLGFIFLYQVDSRQRQKVLHRIRFEERRRADKKKLADEETVAWLNQAVEKIWPICLERFASQEFLMRLAPWFLDKYKPWTAKKAMLHHLHLGSRPPMLTNIQFTQKPAEGYTVVLDMKLDFEAARDMSAVLAVQLRKRLGFGLWTTFHLSRLQLEGKIRVGVKCLPDYPFVERVSLCFEDAPRLQLTVRPIFNYGIDVSELPGIAKWVDKMFADAMERSLVEPNMMVIDVEKILALLMPSTAPGTVPVQPADWFHLEERAPIALVRLEILRGKNLKPSDPNGLADPFVKGSMGLTRIKTTIKQKTLDPVWKEDFVLPVSSWDLPNLLVLRVRDKDRFHDDELGYCVLTIANFRGGGRHLKWHRLRGVKMGKLLVAITVEEKAPEPASDTDTDQRNLQDPVCKNKELNGIFVGPVSKSSQAALSECLQKGIELADSGPESSEASGDDEVEEIDVGSAQGGMVSILHAGKKRTQKCSVKKNATDAVAKREYLAGDSLWDRSIRSLGGVRINVSDDDSDSDSDLNVNLKTRNAEKAAPNPERRRPFWRWRKQKDQKRSPVPLSRAHHPNKSVEPTDMPSEILTVGKKGTEVVMKLEPSEEHLGTLGLHRHDPDDISEPGLVTSGGKSDVQEGRARKAGKGLLRQAGKTVLHLQHFMHRRKKSTDNSSISSSRASSLREKLKDADFYGSEGSIGLDDSDAEDFVPGPVSIPNVETSSGAQVRFQGDRDAVHDNVKGEQSPPPHLRGLSSEN